MLQNQDAGEAGGFTRRAGVVPAWKRRMSLPTRCTLAGQPRFWKFSAVASSPGAKRAAAQRLMISLCNRMLKGIQASTVELERLKGSCREHAAMISLHGHEVMKITKMQLAASCF